MNERKEGGWTPLPHSDEDLQRARSVPHTPQTQSPAYRLAWDDADFLTQRDLRPVRLQLELMKPEMILAERGIRSTVILFGGARIPEPGGEAWAAKNEVQQKNLEANSRYYEEARQFARLCSMKTPMPSTEPSRTMHPSTTSERAPMKQLSSMIVGPACMGSSTPPIPTPPDR